MTRRDMTRRDPWAILYASLIFGGLAIPYCYLALNIAVILLINFPLHLGLLALFLLGASTAVLLLVFIARTPLERRLSQRLGRLFPLLRAILIVLAAGYLVVDILASMNPFPLMLPVASWSDYDDRCNRDDGRNGRGSCPPAVAARKGYRDQARRWQFAASRLPRVWICHASRRAYLRKLLVSPVLPL